MNVYLCITGPLCCTAEINTTLYINYTSIKREKERKEGRREGGREKEKKRKEKGKERKKEGRKKERKRKKAGRREGERKKKREIKQVFKYHGPKWQGGADKCPVWLREHIVQKPS